ncbi:MAG TPA: NAD(P)-binding domain-containing protein, partial [Thermaerobacter sp.]
MDDVIIVGAGPCGLACAAEAHRAGLRYRVLEKGAIVNSLANFPLQMTFFSTSDNLSIAGVPFVTERANPTRREALDYYRAVVDHLGLRVQTFEEVTDIRRDGDTFLVFTRPNRRLQAGWAAPVGEDGLLGSGAGGGNENGPAAAAPGDESGPSAAALKGGNGPAATTPRGTAEAGEGVPTTVYRSRNVVLATGYFDRPNRLGIPGEDLPKVSHYYREGHAFYGREVLVIGGQNSAVEAALDLHRCGARVTLVHRGPALSDRIKPWVLPPFKSLVEKGRITVFFNTVVRAILPDAVDLDVAGEPRRVPNDFVFALVGFRPDHHLARRLGVSIDPATGE